MEVRNQITIFDSCKISFWQILTILFIEEVSGNITHQMPRPTLKNIVKGNPYCYFKLLTQKEPLFSNVLSNYGSSLIIEFFTEFFTDNHKFSV